jgi:Cys-tRNA(Pro)/Cys-tRNA(Cys) deacylase
MEEQCLAHELVYMNAGQRGMQVRLNPRDAVQTLAALVVPIVV